ELAHYVAWLNRKAATTSLSQRRTRSHHHPLCQSLSFAGAQPFGDRAHLRSQRNGRRKQATPIRAPSTGLMNPNRDWLFLVGGFHRVNSVRLWIQDDASFGGPISSSHMPKHSASNTNVSVTNAMSYSGLPRAIDRPQASQSLGAVL